jgi:hypothetical protein
LLGETSYLKVGPAGATLLLAVILIVELIKVIIYYESIIYENKAILRCTIILLPRLLKYLNHYIVYSACPTAKKRKGCASDEARKRSQRAKGWDSS